jgi:hypothetical protein
MAHPADARVQHAPRAGSGIAQFASTARCTAESHLAPVEPQLINNETTTVGLLHSCISVSIALRELPILPRTSEKLLLSGRGGRTGHGPDLIVPPLISHFVKRLHHTTHLPHCMESGEESLPSISEDADAEKLQSSEISL